MMIYFVASYSISSVHLLNKAIGMEYSVCSDSGEGKKEECRQKPYEHLCALMASLKPLMRINYAFQISLQICIRQLWDVSLKHILYTSRLPPSYYLLIFLEPTHIPNQYISNATCVSEHEWSCQLPFACWVEYFRWRFRLLLDSW